MAKILLVEDDTNLSEIYQARMEAEGYTVVSAADGEAALAVAAKEKPDLIISDVMMPKISGFEMLDILRNTAGLKETPVIMLTALGQADDKTRADSLGADRYLVKSQVTLEDIVNAAHALLEDGASSPSSDSDSGATASTDAPAAPPATPATPPTPPSDNAVPTAPAGGTTTTDATTPAPVPAPAPEPVVQQVAVAEPPANDSTPAPVTTTPAADPAPVPAPTEDVEPVAATPVAEEPAAQSTSQASQEVVGGPGLTIAPSGGSAAVNSPAPVDDTDTGVSTPAPHQTAAPLDGAVIDDHVVAGAVDDLLKKPSAGSALSPTSAVGGQRVITPPTEQPRASLDELLAKEAAKESDESSNQPPKPNSGSTNGVDPNSISL